MKRPSSSPLRFYIISATLIVLISLIVFTAYQPTLDNGFLDWEDRDYIINNPHIKALTWQNVQAFFSFYQGNWTPLTWFSHALTYALFGLEPWGHHGVNVLLHCLNTLCLWFLALQVITLVSVPHSTTPYQTVFTATLIALWFGLHPQHVEAVAWVSARKDVLSLFFILSTFICYLLFHQKQEYLGYMFALGCFCLALLAKPIAMTVPFLLLLLDIYPLQRFVSTENKICQYRTIFLEKVPFFLLGGLSFLLTVSAQYQGEAVTDLSVFGINERLLNATHSIILYLSKLLFPIFLSPMYPLSKEISVFPMVATFLITGICIYTAYKKHIYALIAWLFYLITLLPVLGFIQIGGHAAADRFTYLSTLPFYFLIGGGIIKMVYSSKWFLKSTLLMVSLGISVGLFSLTRQQTFIWKNDLILWSYAALYAPNNSLIQSNLGHSYLAQGYYKEALQHYQLALTQTDQQMYYDVGAIYYNAAVATFKLGRYQEALSILEKMAMCDRLTNPPREMIYYQMALIYAQSGSLTQARDMLNQALVVNPQYQAAKDLLVRLHL